MPNPLFVVPIDPLDLPLWQNPDPGAAALIAEKNQLLHDPASGVVDEVAKTLTIYVEFKDFRTKFPIWAKYLSKNKRADEAVQPPPAGFATPAYAVRGQTMLDDARDAFRAPGFTYPATDKSTTTGLNPGMSQSAGTQSLMAGNDGFCLATSHDDLSSKAMLYDSLDNGDLFGTGSGMLFIEELPVPLQDDLNTYLSAPGTPLPPALKAKLTELDNMLATKNPNVAIAPRNWTGILAKAQEKGIKVFGIDGGDADPGISSQSAGFAEPRDVKMNKLAADVIAKARADNPTLKFVASMGAAHANTHEGGIPGLAQILDVPTVAVDTTNGGSLAPIPEDPSKRRMPSKEEQAFIDRYIKVVESDADLGSLPEDTVRVFRAEIYKNANKLAKSLLDAGTITGGCDIGKVLNDPAVTAQKDGLAKLMKAWGNRAADPDAAARLAITANCPAMLDTLAGEAPAIMTNTDREGQGLLHWAARVGRGECITALVAKGADPNQADTAGMKPVHLAVQRRREPNDVRSRDQAEALQALITGGANKDATDPQGKTAAHYAALNNNVGALDKLNTAGADLTIADGRGWTPYDVAVGSTKVAAEKFFYANGKTNPPMLAPSDPALSTIEVLMRATKCENPADVAKIQAAYEQLYARKELRPILELVALDAMKPRDPDGGGGLRLYVADDDNVGGLYASTGSTSPGGAYDDGAHVLMVGSKTAGDFAGTLIHEMTHVAARLVYGDDVEPFDDNSSDEYQDAILRDVKNTALLLPGGSQLESDVNDRMSGRMGGYVAKYANTAQKTLNQEFIVGIPQLMAQYGPDEVRKLSPGMSAYFEGTFTEACKAKAQGGDYATERRKTDNTALGGLPPPPPSSNPPRNATGTGTADDAVALIRANYLAQNGTVPPGTIVYDPKQFKLAPADNLAFEAKMQRVERAIRKTFTAEGLPPDVAADALRALALELGPVIKATAKPKDLDDLVADRAKTWARQSKIDYLAHCSESGITVPDKLLAEAVVIHAENLAWVNGAPVDDKEHLAVDVDAKKHQSMITQLTQSLGTLGGDKKVDPFALMNRLARPLSGDQTKGFYRKGEKRIGKRDPDHVSIDVKSAKRAWLQTLATI